jgi:hypothetical protein
VHYGHIDKRDIQMVRICGDKQTEFSRSKMGKDGGHVKPSCRPHRNSLTNVLNLDLARTELCNIPYRFSHE